MYYGEAHDPELGRVVVISTEITAIRLYPAIPETLNELALGDFLILGSPLWLDKTCTVFSAIRLLGPGHRLLATAAGTQVVPYWDVPKNTTLIRYRTEQEYIDHYLALLTTAIRDRMRTDRMIISLSGGMDSSAIAAIATDLNQRGETNTALAALVSVYDRIMPDTEAYYAGLVARKLKLDVDFVPQDQYRIVHPLPLYAQPIQAYSRGGREMGALLRAHGELMLTGAGSDETLRLTPLWDVLRYLSPAAAVALYAWLWRFQKRRPPLTGLLPYLSQFHPLPSHRPPPPMMQSPERYPQWLNPDFEREFQLKARWDQFWAFRPPAESMLQPNAYKALKQNVWSTITEPLEGLEFPPMGMVVPFLDLRMVAFTLALPPQPFNTRKQILRMAMRDRLPEEVLRRPKTPLGPLLRTMLTLPGAEWVDDWEPIPELARSVIRSAIPKLAGADGSQDFAPVRMRPLALNAWLAHYRRPLEATPAHLPTRDAG
ncbi:MAG: asparagine synthase [Chloroflexi bacterium]|nr:asparagine synthase [Chloroflexota bacterium]